MKKFLISLVGITLAATSFLQAFGSGKALEMAEKKPIEQNRFYPMWNRPKPSLSKLYYGVKVQMSRPTKKEQARWKRIVRPFLVDLFEQYKGGEAKIYSPESDIHPIVLQDGRRYFQMFWKDKVKWERRVTDEIEILGVGDGRKWSEVWLRFIEHGRTATIPHANYAVMLIEAPRGEKPYLADFKNLGRTVAGIACEQSLRGKIGLRKFTTQPPDKHKTEVVHPRLKR